MQRTNQYSYINDISSFPDVHHQPLLPYCQTMKLYMGNKRKILLEQDAFDAQQLVYDAYNSTSVKAKIMLVNKALAISPLCADAFVILAQHLAKNHEEALEYYQKGVEAARLLIGVDFDHYVGNFWGFLETRPYMRARAGLAETLLRLGKIDDAVEHFLALIELNPADNQDLRYLVIPPLLHLHRHTEIKKIISCCAEQNNTLFVYTKLLIAFREKKSDINLLLQNALSLNAFIPSMLTGKKPLVVLSEYVTEGDEDEATYYIEEHGEIWHSTSGAVEWLAKNSS